MPESVVHFQIRMPPDIHERLASWAKEDKASLNMLVVGILEQAIDVAGPSRSAARVAQATNTIIERTSGSRTGASRPSPPG